MIGAVTGSGDRDDRDEVPASSAADDLLRAMAAAPERTMPSPRGADGGDPERFAHFTVLGHLGEGGMGIVYRARVEMLGRTVALKVLPPIFEQDETKRLRFLREASVAAAVTHPNLTTVYEIGESEGRIFIAMELVEGRPMRALLGDRSLPVGTILSLMTQTAAGVAKAHAAGIVHRDLKPENILVSEEGHVKVLDFGLAKRPTDALLVTGTGEGMLLGTPAYMPPEQAHGKPVTSGSDVFSLGVLLFEMLTAQRPFTGTNLPQLIRSIERDTPAAPSSVNPMVPAAFDDIVARCLAKQPAERYPDAQALLEGLRKLEASSSRLSLESTVERPVVDSLVTPSPSTVPRRTRPWRSRLVLLGALVVAGSAVGAFAWSTRTRTTGSPAIATSTASAAGSPRARAMTEWPPPRTSSPEAAALFAAGLQAYRDGSMNQARLRLERALELDPQLAAARLRLGLAQSGDRPIHDLRRQATIAAESRMLLDARDREMLAFLNAVAGPDDAADAARALTQRVPEDAEALMWAARYLNGDGLETEALALLDRALELDPAFAGAAHLRALAFIALGDPDRALVTADRCLAIPPGAPSCLRRRADVHNSRGECAELALDAKRLVAMEQDGFSNYFYLQAALVGQGAPIEALASLTQKAESSPLDAAFARRLALDDAPRVGGYAGDFVTAERSLLMLSKDDEEIATSGLLWVYGEEGDLAKASATAQAYLLKLLAAPTEKTLTGYDVPPLARPLALVSLRAARHMSLSDVRATRDSWMSEWSHTVPTRLSGTLWTWFYAYTAVTSADASEALAALPSYAPLPSYAMAPQLAGALGRVRALAGDVDGALPLLRAEAARCGTALSNPDVEGIDAEVQQVQDRLLLGQMLDQKSDHEGACAQYAAILSSLGQRQTP